MPNPQGTDRLKEVPALVLRALFAGIGQLLLAAEKAANRVVEQLTAAQHPATPARPSPPPADVRPAEETPGQPDNVRLLREAPAPDTDKDSAERLPTATPGDATPQPSTGETARGARAPAQPAASPPPLPNYDELSVASLRARLRFLDAGAVGSLLDYEKSHAARQEVITMFERRLAKLNEAAG